MLFAYPVIVLVRRGQRQEGAPQRRHQRASGERHAEPIERRVLRDSDLSHGGRQGAAPNDKVRWSASASAAPLASQHPIEFYCTPLQKKSNSLPPFHDRATCSLQFSAYRRPQHRPPTARHNEGDAASCPWERLHYPFPTMLASVGLAPAAVPRGACRGKQPSIGIRSSSNSTGHASSSSSNRTLRAGSGVPTTTSTRSRTHTAESRRRRIRVMTRAAEGGEGGEGEGATPEPSASDALAARMAKAKAYKETLQTPDTKSEMEGALKEALSNAPAPPTLAAEASEGGEGGEGAAQEPSAADALAERMAKAKAYKQSLQTPDTKSEMEGALKEALSVAPAPPMTRAAEGGDGGDGEEGEGDAPEPSAADALAERMAKAKAYKESLQTPPDTKSEMEGALKEALSSAPAPPTLAAEGSEGSEGGEAVAPEPTEADALAARIIKAKVYKESLQAGSKSQSETKSEMEGALKAALSSGPPPPKPEVTVTMMTKDGNYNPFDAMEGGEGGEGAPAEPSAADALAARVAKAKAYKESLMVPGSKSEMESALKEALSRGPAPKREVTVTIMTKQGLTLVHFSAQLKRFASDRGCIQGFFRGPLRGIKGY